MYTQEEQQQIADTILHQLGHPGQMRAMIGMSNLIFGDVDGNPYLQFTFKNSRKHNRCRIILTPLDTYTFQLYQFRAKSATCPLTYEQADVYNDMLTEMFERETGLCLSLYAAQRR